MISAISIPVSGQLDFILMQSGSISRIGMSSGVLLLLVADERTN